MSEQEPPIIVHVDAVEVQKGRRITEARAYIPEGTTEKDVTEALLESGRFDEVEIVPNEDRQQRRARTAPRVGKSTFGYTGKWNVTWEPAGFNRHKEPPEGSLN